MLAREIIRLKRDGEALDAERIHAFVNGIADGSVGDEQLGAFAMAVYLNDMNDAECIALTEAMRDSGEVMRWDEPALPGPVLDKHSTGGVGDATSLLIGPWVAACGGFVPMIAGPGLGHTGGTVDKMNAIPGYCTAPDAGTFQRVVRDVGVAIIGQTADLAPADRRLYGVRDTTATVESMPLIVASILSKKLAEGLDALVLDIKIGNGAVMPQIEQARVLARMLGRVAAGAGTSLSALITDMNQPLAANAGNALEVREVIDMLTGRLDHGRLLALGRELAAEMLLDGHLAEDRDEAFERLDAALRDGRVAEHFARMVAALGGPSDLLERPGERLKHAPVMVDVHANEEGFVASIDVRRVGMAVVELGGGRRRAGDRIDPAVGLESIAGIGDAVGRQQPLARVHAASREQAEIAARQLRAAVAIAESPPTAPELVLETVREGGS